MTRQQQWASQALSRVEKYKKGAAFEKAESEYRTLCMKMPVLLKQSGLCQAVAFMRSRAGSGKQFCEDLAEVYGLAERPATADKPARTPGEVLSDRAMTTKELGEYLALSRDVIEVSVWFRRFAQSELEGND